MEMFEKVEKIVEKTGVTYEEAKKALEVNNNDILDAIVYLEKQGKVNGPKNTSYTSVSEEATYTKDFDDAQANYEKMCEDKKGKKAAKKFWAKCKEILDASIRNTFTISRQGEIIATIPVLVLVLLLVFAFYVVVPLLVVGLFFDFKYSFQGFTNVSVDFNNVCDKASDIASDLKEDVVSHKTN